MFFRVMGRLTIRFFAGIGRFFAGLFRSFIKHPVGWVFSLLLIGGVIAAWILTDGFGFKLGDGSESGVITAEQSTQSSGKSEDFMNAFSKLDANAMWNLLSEDFKKSQVANGIANADAMQKAMNAKIAELAKDGSKPKYKFLWNNGRANSDGSAFDVFQSQISWPGASDRFPRSLVYGVGTDKDGKINNVLSQTPNGDSSDPVLGAAFPTTKTASKGQGQEAGQGAPTAKRNPVTEDLMAGLTNFDAKRVWNALSPSYQKELTDKKITVDTMQAAFDSFRKDAEKQKTKINYVGYTYQVSTNYTNSFATDVYVSALQYGDSVYQFDYLFLLDSNNKVMAVGFGGTPDPIFSKALGRNQQQ